MMNIGEFAALTGLSVKALRHYDERGVLSPASVDPGSGYRKYSEDQVRYGVALKTLRDAGVPVPDAAAAADSAVARVNSAAAGEVGGSDSAEPGADGSRTRTARSTSPADALQAHRAAVLKSRQEEDRAYARARAIIRSLGQPVTVDERPMSARPFVAVTFSAPIDSAAQWDDDHMDDVVTRAAEDLWQRLAADGIHPAGPLWITMRMQDRETIELACCLPVPHRLPAGWGGEDVEVSELPERVELCAVWSPADGDEVPDGVTHPAVIGLLDAYAEHSTVAAFTDVREIRQTATGTSADDWTVEIAVTLR